MPTLHSVGITQYGFNEKRPRSEFRPVLFSFVIALHLLAVAAIVWHAVAGFWPSWTVIGMAVGLYVFTGFGIALGYHRLFTHQGYECGPFLKGLLLLAGGMSLEGAIDNWVRTHKFHHAFADKPGDAHSPFQYGGTRWLALKGILWSHVGWLFYDYKLPVRERPDRIDRDRMMQFQSRHYLWLVIGTFALPAVVCGLVGWSTGGLHGLWAQALDGFLVAGVLRVVLLLNVTWAINSVCHLWGEQMAIQVIEREKGQPKLGKYYPSDGSRNAGGLKALSFGEANHALHHLFDQIAYHGWRKRDVDPAKWVLILLERANLAWNVKKPPEFVVLPLEVNIPDDSFVAAARQAKELVGAAV